MRKSLLAALLIATSAPAALAHSITSEVDQTKNPAFDITTAQATTDGRLTTFMMEVAGFAGSVKPVPVGQLTGSKVESYVWPTSLDPSTVGFDPGIGILALAITAIRISTTHPCSMRTRTAIRPMTAPTGIPIGWCWSRKRRAAPG